MSLRVEIAEALRALLAGATFGLGVTVRRSRVPVVDLKDLTGAGVILTVVPRAVEEALASRSESVLTVRVDVGVQCKPATLDDADLDPLDDLVEALLDVVRRQRLTLAGGTTAVWVSHTNEPIVLAEHLDEDRVYSSVVTVTYRLVV